jgi:hypothetical protein
MLIFLRYVHIYIYISTVQKGLKLIIAKILHKAYLQIIT